MSNYYSRPKNIDNAEQVIIRNHANLFFPEDIGVLTRSSEQHILDLQDLPLRYIKREENDLLIGGTTVIESIYSYTALDLIFSKSIAVEFGLNKRNRHTIGTILRACSGKSLFMSLLVALDAKIQVIQNNGTMTIGQWIDDNGRRFSAVKQITIPEYDYVNIEWNANTPMSLPDISLAAARLRGGRTRIVLGGITPMPELVIDGQVSNNIVNNIENACSHYININKYRHYYKSIIKTLLSRHFEKIIGFKE